MELIKAEIKDLPHIYSQMEDNFIREEIRDYPDAEAVFANPKYTVYHVVDADKKVGFMCVWSLNGITFLEHFVIYGQYRGNGYGGKAFDILRNKVPLLILECEPPVSHDQKRRVGFYTRHGMILNENAYRQPPYRKGGEGCSLKLMSSNKLERFEEAVKEIYREVYQVEYE